MQKDARRHPVELNLKNTILSQKSYYILSINSKIKSTVFLYTHVKNY